ncbi:MAG: DJ-1/PfpI family protein [Actinobacteria bacterium]|nr:DJ-1/PfpI family protein [Actinomycetota bacterium]MCB9388888.1 DJ-1/PfpI family protein [Acidimicrobiia bacterium]
MSDHIRIGVLAYAGADEFDLIVPYDTLSIWAQRWPRDQVTVAAISRESRPQRLAKGIRIIPEATWAGFGRLDALVIPGGPGLIPLMNDQITRGWLQRLAETKCVFAAMCTGVLLLGNAGVIEDEHVSVHSEAAELLSAMAPKAQHASTAVARHGRLITSSSAHGTLDAAIELVRTLKGASRAEEVASLVGHPTPQVVDQSHLGEEDDSNVTTLRADAS